MISKSKKKFAVIMGSFVLATGLFNINSATVNASDGTSEYSGAPGARATLGGLNGTELFLGGNYIELGISNWGDFGTEGTKPANFRGTLNGEINPYGGVNQIGMSADYDGYNNGRDLPIDYYLPGSPEERFAVGYKTDGSTYTNSNSALNYAKNMATTVSDASVISEGLLKANILSTWSNQMEISQSISFKVSDKFYRNEVTIKNLTDQTWDSARYMRSFDPDNTVFRGGSFDTANTVTHTIAEDGKAVVKAETYINSDPMYVATGSRIPFFFYSKDPAAKASVFGFSNSNPYVSSAYDNPTAKGNTINSDIGITLTWDSGQLPPGESKSFIYYSSLDERDFEEVEKDIEETKYPVNFSVVDVDGEANGILTATVDNEVITSADEVVEGKNVVFTATPDEGYHIKQWKLNDMVVEVEGEPLKGNTFTVESHLKSETVTVEFELTDVTAPTTTDDAPEAWENEDVKVTLTASDAGSGVKETYYQVNDGEQQTGTTVQITEEGTHTLTYWSEDEAGNIEEKNTATINIDKKKPTTTDDAPEAWKNEDVTVTLSASDAESGVKATYYQVNDGEQQTGTTVQITEEGMHTLTYWSEDEAGNIEEKNSATINIDKKKPTTTDDAPEAWKNEDVTVTLSASDAESGVKATYYQVNDGEQQTGTTVQITEEGTHNLTYWSEDEAGNIESKNNATINIDKSVPTVNFTPNVTSLWSPNNKLVDINIVIDADGGLSGLNTIVLTSITSNEDDSADDIQDAEYGTDDTNFKLRAKREGKGTGRIYTITYTVTDQAGNETVSTATIDVPHDQGKKIGNKK